MSVTKGGAMPNVEVSGPPLSDEKKREMALEMTECAARGYGLPKQAIVVVITEHPPQNVCVAGRMVCDDRAVLTED
jgi:4-oxalocrotonate tautomerase family enzyme